ncbi:MAG TPA: class I SAM-dependent methyltransferase [Planctomycetota bacterium]|nr:class I SAM-dependent methyltransferase [Planctomycetota bacterium]
MDPEGARQAERLKERWETLARSPYREFFVASHAGWRDPARREAQARQDAAVLLTAFDDSRLARSRTLEIGCGSGRLARVIAPRCAEYVGVDISPTMAAAAARACSGLRARILVGDGAALPPELNGERFDLVYSVAVFIHVEAPILRSYLESVARHLAPDGQFRFQALLDPRDPTGYAAPEGFGGSIDDAPPESSPTVARAGDLEIAPEAAALLGDDYMGRRYAVRELRELVAERFPRFALYRLDPLFGYVVASL